MKVLWVVGGSCLCGGFECCVVASGVLVGGGGGGVVGGGGGGGAVLEPWRDEIQGAQTDLLRGIVEPLSPPGEHVFGHILP